MLSKIEITISETFYIVINLIIRELLIRGHIRNSNQLKRVEIRGVKMVDIEIGRNISFWYLGSIIQDNRELMENVTNKIKASWVKWRTSGSSM